MAPRVTFDWHRFKELVLYIALKSSADEQFGATKLNKLLSNSDFRAYLELGKPITGARYQHSPQGPTARALLPAQDELLDHGEAQVELRDYYGKEQVRLVALREPNLEAFAPEELALVDDEIRKSWGKDAATMSYLSHVGGRGWQITTDGQDIPYESAFLSPDVPPVTAIALGQEIADKHGWSVD
jgi:hypothetical protein